MLDYNPATRISAEEALQHPYFTQCAPAPPDNVFVAEVGPRFQLLGLNLGFFCKNSWNKNKTS
jgi:hypothetical protein